MLFHKTLLVTKIWRWSYEEPVFCDECISFLLGKQGKETTQCL
jgi:hypothetical protein